MKYEYFNFLFHFRDFHLQNEMNAILSILCTFIIKIFM